MASITHVERESLNSITDGVDIWTMWCGEQCLAMPDESPEPLLPAGFDFYLEQHAHKANCEPCKAALAAGKTKTAHRETA